MPSQSFPSSVRPSVIEAIGNTPVIRLRRASELTGCEIWGKAEFMNPGQSVKDRAALAIIRDAESKGLLSPGGLIVEGTAGNTGIGLAMVGRALGYRSAIVIPRTQSQEKKDAIRLLGAELIEVDAVPYSNPMNYVRYSGALATERAKTEPNGAIWANQFDNIANRQGHYETTGPEIWAQTEGRLDGFVCAVGSGGTLAGVAMALRERDPEIAIGLADPFGASLFNWYTAGELKAEGSSITEGIGQGRVTANLEGIAVDHAWQIPDAEALEILFDLVQHEGLCLGGSSGVNIAGAIRLARELGPGKTIVTILADLGQRYQAKLYNPEFLKERGLPSPALDVAMPDDPLVSTEWLHEHLGDTRVKVLDGSWFLPGDPRDPRAAFLEAHIPGAQFFDIDEISDKTSALPHMAPSPEQFAFQVGELGIGGEDTVVVYDQAGLFSAPRVWWSLRLFGHGKAFVLDGGLPAWTREGRPLEHGAPAPPAAGDFAVLTAHPELVRNLDQVWRALEQHSEQVVDVRSAERFRGVAPEPRPGLRAGHMPGAINLPIGELMDAEGRLKPAPALARAFEAAGVDLDGAIVTSCGSGIAASLAALGLARLNHWNAAVYDGSWSEWGAHAAAPVVTGP